MVTAALVLLLLGAGWIWQIDTTIRATMLPAAPPVASLEQEQPYHYRIVLLGRELNLSLEGLTKDIRGFYALLRTPPAPVRLFFQLRAYTTGELPRHLREDPRKAYEG